MELQLPTTAAALGEYFDAAVVGDEGAEVLSLVPLTKASKGNLSFCASRKYGGLLNQIEGAVLFTRPELVRPELPLTYLVVNDPQAAFAKVARLVSARNQTIGISPLAQVDRSAVLASNVAVGAYAVIGSNVKIGAGTVIAPFTYIGHDVMIGEHCQIYPHVVLLDRITIGNRVRIFPGSVLGGDGFGMMRAEAQVTYSEMPQIGTVVIEDDVRIGANCTIDRGTLGETRIKRGCKLDDQVHVAHNVRIDENCILCAQTGVAGSSVLETNVVLGGQAGVGDHLTIGKNARLGGKCGALQSIEGDEDYLFTPAIPLHQCYRSIAQFKKLPELAKRVRKLEQLLEERKGHLE